MSFPGLKKTAAGHSFYSLAPIALMSLAGSFFVFAASLVLQWIVYDDWLHRTGPLRITGTSLATVVTFFFVFRWQLAARKRRQELFQRIEIITQMNDRIRNALQIIECTIYVSQPDAIAAISQAVDAIDSALREASTDASTSVNNLSYKKSA